MPLIRLLWVLLRLLLGVDITLMPLVSLIVDPSIPIPGIPSGIPSQGIIMGLHTPANQKVFIFICQKKSIFFAKNLSPRADT
jgi:hypothetical protein